jgi:hypothetical protein
MGTIGLTWAILGVKGSQRWIVIPLLCVGVSAIAARLLSPLVDSLGDMQPLLSFHLSDFLSMLLTIWCVMGPVAVGVYQLAKLVREAVARSPNTSFERTREG